MFSALALSICLLGCSKTEVTPVVVTQAAPSSAVVSPTVQGPTTQLEAIGAVKIAPQEPVKAVPKATQVGVKVVGVKKHTTNLRSQLERAAYRVAFLNKIEYVCIKAIVDIKIDRDIKAGEITDKGSVVTYFNSVSKDELAMACIGQNLVNLDDVREFDGKV